MQTHFKHGQELPLYVDPKQVAPSYWVLIDSRYIEFGPVLSWPDTALWNVYTHHERELMKAWKPRPGSKP